MTEFTDVDTQSCPICSGQGHFSFSSADRLHDLPGEYSYMECGDCGAVYQTPMPIAEEIAAFYPEDYSPYRPGRTKQLNPLERGVLRSCYGYSHIKSPVPGWLARLFGSFAYRDSVPYVSGGRMLDIGCGGGKYLLSMQGLGWQPQGVEFNEFAVQTCRQSGLDVFQGELSDAGLSDDTVDLVTARHVIEHIADPIAFVREIYRILKPGGMMVLKTPNSTALGRGWFGVDWFANDVPRHLILFSPANLKLLAENQGFQQEVSRTFSSPKIVLNSWDYWRGNQRESSKRRKLRRIVARLYVIAAVLSGRGDEVFVIFRKPLAGGGG